MRHLSSFDKLIGEVDAAVRSLLAPENRPGVREQPGLHLPEVALKPAEKKQAAALMRVNHSGEVCAQALYQGQAMTARLSSVKQQMQEAALEETDHLAWCEARLRELGAKPARLNPLWYVSSWTLGAFAGLMGDRISLGFVAETELQVSAHLQKHLESLPKEDQKTRSILERMHEDESLHAQAAQKAGAIPLPNVVKKLMGMSAKLMTKTSYYF